MQDSILNVSHDMHNDVKECVATSDGETAAASSHMENEMDVCTPWIQVMRRTRKNKLVKGKG